MNIGRFFGVRLEDYDADACMYGLDSLYVNFDSSTDNELQAQIDAWLDEQCTAAGVDRLEDVDIALRVTEVCGAHVVVIAYDVEKHTKIPVQLTTEELAGIAGLFAENYARRLKETWSILSQK